MTHAQRMAAMKRLRKAAEKAIGAPDVEAIPDYRRRCNEFGLVCSLEFAGVKLVPSAQFARLERAWRAFPECERDEAVPPPHEVLAICERMEREQAADDAFALACAGR